jgi:hypothetical protein
MSISIVANHVGVESSGASELVPNRFGILVVIDIADMQISQNERMSQSSSNDPQTGFLQCSNILRASTGGSRMFGEERRATRWKRSRRDAAETERRLALSGIVGPRWW